MAMTASKTLMAFVTILYAVSGLIPYRVVAEELHWYRGNTHTHTSAPEHSDANESPEIVAAWYRDHGYQFLVISDHDHLTDVDSLNESFAKEHKFLLIPGQEVTQMVADQSRSDVRHAHVNGINMRRLVMPLVPPNADQAQADEIRRQGSKLSSSNAQERYAAVQAVLRARAISGISMSEVYKRNVSLIREAADLVQINHPNLQWSVTPADLLPLDGMYLLEIWNGYPSSNNLGGTDEQGRIGMSAEALWDVLLSAGRVVWGVGSDDSHTYHQFENPEAPNPGKAWIVVRATSLSRQSILSALKSGSFYASTGVELTRYEHNKKGISLEIRPLADWAPALSPTTRYITRFIGKDGRVLAETNGVSPAYALKGNEHYVRASIIDSDGRRAWTQPVFLDGRKVPE
jgi:hypothetical protein